MGKGEGPCANTRTRITRISTEVPNKSSRMPQLHLDDLAGAVQHANRWTRAASVVLAILWIFFLITVRGLHMNA